MINYKLTDITGKVIGTITLEDDTIPRLIMDDVEILLGGSFVLDKNIFLNFTVIIEPTKEKVRVGSNASVVSNARVIFCTRNCCDTEKTRGPNTEGKLVCPIHCSKCGHARQYEDYYDFCSECRAGDPCSRYI